MKTNKLVQCLGIAAGIGTCLLISILHGSSIQLKEEQRQASNASLLYALDKSCSAGVVLDGDGKIVQWNSGAEKLFGFSTSEAIGKGIEIIASPELANAHKASYIKAMHVGKSAIKEVACVANDKNGNELPITMLIITTPPHQSIAIVMKQEAVLRADYTASR